MNTLAAWLREQLTRSNLTRQTVAVHAGVSGATLSDMLNHDHVPRMDILFRLADYFHTPREEILRMVARMPPGGPDPDPDAYLIDELLHEFRQVPDAWKPEAVRQIQMFRRLAELPPVRIIGDEDKKEEQPQPAPQDENNEKP